LDKQFKSDGAGQNGIMNRRGSLPSLIDAPGNNILMPRKDL